MIIQHPDGSYEICPLAPALARWARALLRRVQELHAAVRAGQAGPAAINAGLCPHCDGGAC